MTPAEPRQAAERCLELLRDLGRRRALGEPVAPAQAQAWAGQVWTQDGPAHEAAVALADPYLALTMLWRVLDLGWRGNPVHPRPRDGAGPRLAADLLAFLRLHLRIRGDLPSLVEWPADGLPHQELAGDGGWCDLCGECCCHAGTVPTPPPGVEYPAYWYHALAGSTLYPQPFCPFLFQARGLPVFFCGMHPVKPQACRQFGPADCRRGRPHRGYRPPEAKAGQAAAIRG